MIKLILGIIVGIILLLGAGFVFLTRGGVNMATDSKPLPFERYLAHRALDGSIGAAAQDQSPVAADEATLMAGARLYEDNCMGCHGVLGKGASGLSKRMYPHIPPLLPPADGVTDDPIGETHWVIKNGIRFSGMASFGSKLSETELWQLSQLLHNADKLPPAVQDALRGKQ